MPVYGIPFALSGDYEKVETIDKIKDFPNLKKCRDYSILQKLFTKRELDLYERQLKEYLDMEEITDTYLDQVPRIICWYEGIIPTEDFIRGYYDCMRRRKNINENRRELV